MSRRTSAENLRDLSREPNPGDLEAGLRQALQEREDGRLEETNHEHSSDSLQHLSTSPTPAVRQPPPPHVTGMTPLTGDEEHPRLSATSSPEMQHISRAPSDGSSHGPGAEEAGISPIDMGRLSRVPSYNTANSSNILNLDPISQALPTYSSVTSSLPTIQESRSRSGSSASQNQPASQVRRPSPPQTGLSSDPRSGHHTSRIGGVYGSPQTFDDPMRRISLMRSMFASR